jgi:GTP-binding protein Era
MLGRLMDDPTQTQDHARGGRCAIVGRPNVGKSTLLNAALGQKLVIATARPGTTRTAVLGVYAKDSPPTQIAFVDTPGLTKPKSALGKVLVEEAEAGLLDADVVLFVTDVGQKRPRVHPEDLHVLTRLEHAGTPVVLVINKVDRLENKAGLLPLMEEYSKLFDFAAVVPISATKKINLPELLEEIRERLPEGLLYEDEEFLTDRPTRFFVAELVREAAIRQTRKEVPYGVAVVIERMDEEPAFAHIHATLIVEKESHKGIVIGKGGEKLKIIGTEARQGIERLVGHQVFLKLWVKVMAGWTGDPNKARNLATKATT